MGDITKVKLMDSGTVRFMASSMEDAMRRVRAVLSLYGTVSTGLQENTQPKQGGVAPEEGLMVLDCSDSIYHQFVTALIEPTSVTNQWAVSFREGNAATTMGVFLLRLGAFGTCHKRVEAIINALDNK